MGRFLTGFSFLIIIAFADIFAGEVYFEEAFSTQTLEKWKSIDVDQLTVEATSTNTLQSYGVNLQDGKLGWGAGLLTPDSIKFAALCTSRYNPSGTANDWLISPEIEIGDFAVLEWYAMSLSSTVADKYQVFISTTGDDVTDFKTVLMATSGRKQSWSKNSVNLSKLGYKNQKIFIAFRNNTKNGFILALDKIKIWIPIEFDLAVYGIALPAYSHKTANGITVPVNFRNLGAKEITSFDFTYQFDGEEPVTSKVQNTGIKADSFKIINHPMAWKPTALNARTVNVWIANVNDHASNDEKSANDSADGTTFVYDNSNSKQIFPLFEEFTSSTCDSSAKLHTTLNPLLNSNKEKMTLIKYQMSVPGTGDPYYIPECGTRKNFYEINNDIPFAFANGEEFNLLPNNINQTSINSIISNPGFFDILNPVFTIKDSVLKFQADVKSLANFSNESIVAHVAVIEMKTYKNASTNGETEFINVLKKMLPNAQGVNITKLGQNSVQSISLEYKFPETATVEEFDDLAVVVWLQNKTNHRVLESAWAVKKVLSVPYENDGNGVVAVFPNPASTNAKLRYAVKGDKSVTVGLYTIDGNIVSFLDKGVLTEGYYLESFNVQNLGIGTYIIKLEIGDKVFFEKLNVVR